MSYRIKRTQLLQNCNNRGHREGAIERVGQVIVLERLSIRTAAGDAAQRQVAGGRTSLLGAGRASITIICHGYCCCKLVLGWGGMGGMTEKKN
jgi:hypothetical protein